MWKLNKILIKKGFRSILNSKFFSILMILLIFIAGTTYTMLSSASNAFRSSYDEVVSKGKLQDYVVKENFQIDEDDLKKSAIDLRVIYEKDGKIMNVSDSNTFDESELNKVKNEIPGSGNPENNHYKYELYIKPFSKGTGIFKDVQVSFSDKIEIEKTSIDEKFNKKDVQLIKNKIESIKSVYIDIARRNLANIYIDKLHNDPTLLYEKDKKRHFVAKNIESIFIGDKTKSFKVVNYGSDKGVNNMLIYDGSKNFTENITQEQFKNQLNIIAKSNDKNIDSAKYDYSKKYKAVILDDTGAAGTFTDPNAYQAIISPGYANANNKKAITQDELKNLFQKNPYIMDDINKELLNRYRTNDSIYEKYKDNIILVGKTPFIITGIGSTPDFMYPIMDATKPIVDVKEQVVVFLSDNGYSRIFEAFRTNPQENYIALKFDDDATSEYKDRVVNYINKVTRTGENGYPISHFPASIKLVTTTDDMNDNYLLTQERTQVLNKVQSTISTISYVTTTMLIIFIIAIPMLVFKVLISGSRKVYASMYALGYSKFQIAISNSLAAFVLAIIPAMLSYAIGYGLQFIFIDQFSSIWTIPTYGNSFSIMALLVLIAIPTIIVFLIIFITTYIELRYNIPDMLNDSAGSTFTGFTSWISKIKYIGVKEKYALALTMRNFGKLILLTLSSTVAVTSIVVGLGTLGKANKAYNETASVSKYQFAVDLVTPTTEGGQYDYVNIDSSTGSHKMPTSAITSENNDSDTRWHSPTAIDISYTDPNSIGFDYKKSESYLKGVLQNQAFLKTAEVGTTAWNIAKRLMPENQRNLSNEDMRKIKIRNNISAEILSIPKEKVKVRTAIDNMVEDILSNKDADIPYIISYNKVLMRSNDERYTYINAIDKNTNNKLIIRGVDSNTKMIGIDHTLLNKANEEFSKDNDYVPIFINKYLSKSLSKDSGDSMELNVVNTIDRKHKGYAPKKINAKIMAIIDGYNNKGIYTTRKIANSVLKLGKNAFNGVFTKSKRPVTLETLPLYSESGLYVGTDSLNKDGWNKVVQNYIDSDSWNKETTGVSTTAQFISKYSSTPYTSTIRNASWKEMDQIAFSNTSDLSSTIINLIEYISISLSIIFTVIVATLMFRSNRKKIAALWTLGYRKREINYIFTITQILPILLSFGISVALSIGILETIKLFIMRFGHILIPMEISWWHPLVAFGAIGTIFVASTSITIWTHKSKIALEAFKGD